MGSNIERKQPSEGLTSMHAAQIQSATVSEAGKRHTARAPIIAGAGAIIILISLAAALLPFADGLSSASVVGTMMGVAGTVEMIAGSMRRRTRPLAIFAGMVTVVAGALFALQPFGEFVPTVRLVIGWLAARGAVLVMTSLLTRGSIRIWTIIAAATDLSLSAILLIGLSAITFQIALFGPTPEIVSSFAWVLALSFVATGALMLEVAACEAEEDSLLPRPRVEPQIQGEG